MAAPVAGHKLVRVNKTMLGKAKRYLGAKTDTETVERALALVTSEAQIDKNLRAARGKAVLKKVFD